MIKRCLLGIFLLGLAMVAALAVYGWHWLHSPQWLLSGKDLSEPLSSSAPTLDASLTLELQPGDSLSALAYRLQRDYDFRHPRLWVLYARLSGQDNIKLGEYEIQQPVSPRALLSSLYRGEVKLYSLTLVEGTTVDDALQRLQAQPSLQRELTGLSTAELASRLGITQSNPEGWLFPDTYFYTSQTSDWQLVQQAYRRMQQVLAEEWQQRADNLPYDTPYEALIMASIIERETGAPHERGEIAGVFVRRLQRGMRLQTDPTVIYGMGDSYQGRIGRKDLLQATPYNTYRIAGLPPTPIALPGREAIHAALHPEPGDSLFFVARGDGTHYFSATLEEHQEAVRRYQLQRSQDYRSRYQPQ